jgi:hypothetical protein
MTPDLTESIDKFIIEFKMILINYKFTLLYEIYRLAIAEEMLL